MFYHLCLFLFISNIFRRACCSCLVLQQSYIFRLKLFVYVLSVKSLLDNLTLLQLFHYIQILSTLTILFFIYNL